MEKATITVQTTVNAPLKSVWHFWTTPADIVQWNHASEEWHTPNAENDVRTGGSFSIRMEAKDGSAGFDFAGTYDRVVDFELIEYTLADGRIVHVSFEDENGHTKIVETFEAERTNPVDMQRAGWQAILDNFKRYADAQVQ